MRYEENGNLLNKPQLLQNDCIRVQPLDKLELMFYNVFILRLEESATAHYGAFQNLVQQIRIPPFRHLGQSDSIATTRRRPKRLP
jgi:hypothetical protein